jgi:hypothetical protein
VPLLTSAPPALERCSRRRLIGLLTALFGAWHAVLYAAGVRFDTSTLEFSWQFLASEWLRTDLVRSLVALHSQPPLFNLLLGVVFKLAPGHESVAFQALFTSGAYVLYLALFGLLRQLGVSRGRALIVSTLYLTSPGVVLYEHWLFYTFPISVLVALSALLLMRALRRPSLVGFSAAFLCVASLGLLRSVFHPLHFIFTVIGVFAVVPRAQRGLIVKCAVLPLILILTVATKNLVLFGSTGSSSWLGMNVARVALGSVNKEVRQTLAAQGQLTPTSIASPFSEVDVYPRCAAEEVRPDWPQLTVSQTPSGIPNYNHARYLCASRDYLQDSITVVRLHPAAVLRTLARSWVLYFRPVSEYGLLTLNKTPLRTWEALHDVLSPKLPLPQMWLGFTELPFTTGILLPTLFLLSAWIVRRRASWGALDREQMFVVLYALVTGVAFALVVNTLESGENNRFRAEVDPLHAVLFGLVVDRLWKRWRRPAIVEESATSR